MFIMPILVGLGLWAMGEFVAFSLVAQAIGLQTAIIATLLISLAGLWLLRRLGSAARDNLAVILNMRDLNMREIPALRPEHWSAGFTAALGSVLLILPGFLSDAVGLVLIARSAAVFGGLPLGRRQERQNPEVVELAPGDYWPTDERKPR